MNTKTLFTLVLTASLAGLSAPAFAAAALDLTRASYQPATVEPPLREKASMPAGAIVPRSLMPLSLLGPNALCDAKEPRKVCEVRRAAQRRAAEVIAAETQGANVTHAAELHTPLPTGLLIPVAQPVCDPRMTPAECDRAVRGLPPGPLPPVRVPPPISPVPPFPVPPVIPPSAPVPEEAPTPPVAVDPEAVIPPPEPGDRDILQPPPSTESKMPVIVPKPAPIVQ